MPAAALRHGRGSPTADGLRRRPRIRLRSNSAESLPVQEELCLEEVVLDAESVRNSPMLPYLRMLVNLIEGLRLRCEELVELLIQALRQHSIASQRRTDYVLRFLHEHPP